MSAHGEIEQQIRSAPDLPGVYLFRDDAGEALYVGKAASLRKRLANYLSAVREKQPDHPSARVLEMGRRAAAVEWMVASSESEALLLEHNFIRRHRPPFNIRLRDDKSYPYIVVTLEDEFPRVMFTRAPHRKGNMYFGPYASAAKARETLDILGRIFSFRKCRGLTPGRRSGSPCSTPFTAARHLVRVWWRKKSTRRQSAKWWSSLGGRDARWCAGWKAS